MSTFNHGGPAFPCDRIHDKDDRLVSHVGMTMRDYFASHATTDDVAAHIKVLRLRCERGILPDDYMAICRYMHADAMLRARSQP